MISQSDIKWCWEQAKPIPGKNPDLYRIDEEGYQIHWPSYGKNSPQGWEIDHRKPIAKGGTDHRRNLRALNTKANRLKSDQY